MFCYYVVHINAISITYMHIYIVADIKAKRKQYVASLQRIQRKKKYRQSLKDRRECYNCQKHYSYLLAGPYYILKNMCIKLS